MSTLEREIMRAGGVLLFGKLAMACPIQIANIFLQRGILAAANIVLLMEGVGVVLWRDFVSSINTMVRSR